MIPEGDFIAFPFTFLMVIDQFQYEWKLLVKKTRSYFLQGESSSSHLSYLCGESIGQVFYLFVLLRQCQGTQPPPLYCFSGFLLGIIVHCMFFSLLSSICLLVVSCIRKGFVHSCWVLLCLIFTSVVIKMLVPSPKDLWYQTSSSTY